MKTLFSTDLNKNQNDSEFQSLLDVFLPMQDSLECLEAFPTEAEFLVQLEDFPTTAISLPAISCISGHFDALQ